MSVLYNILHSILQYTTEYCTIILSTTISNTLMKSIFILLQTVSHDFPYEDETASAQHCECRRDESDGQAQFLRNAAVVTSDSHLGNTVHCPRGAA